MYLMKICLSKVMALNTLKFFSTTINFLKWINMLWGGGGGPPGGLKIKKNFFKKIFILFSQKKNFLKRKKFFGGGGGRPPVGSKIEKTSFKSILILLNFHFCI